MFSSSEVLDMAIRIEKNGEKAYRDAIDKIGNQELVSTEGDHSNDQFDASG